MDTWIPLVDMFGANAGVIRCQFSTGRPSKPSTTALTSVSLTVEKATLLITASEVLGKVRWKLNEGYWVCHQRLLYPWQGASDNLIQPRVKVRVHPGRMAYTTLLAKADSGVNPEWRETFVLPPPTALETSPCISFRQAQRC